MSDGPKLPGRKLGFGRLLLLVALLLVGAGVNSIYPYNVPLALCGFVLAGALLGHPIRGALVGVLLLFGAFVTGVDAAYNGWIGAVLYGVPTLLVSLLICFWPKH